MAGAEVVELPAAGAEAVPVLEAPVRGCEVVEVDPEDVWVPAAGEVVLVVGCDDGAGLAVGVVLLEVPLEGAGCALEGCDCVGAGAAAGWVCWGWDSLEELVCARAVSAKNSAAAKRTGIRMDASVVLRTGVT